MSGRRSAGPKSGKTPVVSGEENALFKKTVREMMIPPLEPSTSVTIGCFLGAVIASAIAPINGGPLAILCGMCIALLCMSVLGAIQSWYSPVFIGYPSAVLLYTVVCMAMQDPKTAMVFGQFQYVDRVIYCTIVGVAIGYSRDTTVNRSFAKLACGPEWDELDLTLSGANPPVAAAAAQKPPVDRNRSTKAASAVSQ